MTGKTAEIQTKCSAKLKKNSCSFNGEALQQCGKTLLLGGPTVAAPAK